MGPAVVRARAEDGRHAADVAGDGPRGQRLQPHRHDVRGKIHQRFFHRRMLGLSIESSDFCSLLLLSGEFGS